MLPVMLIPGAFLTQVIVALSLAAIFTVVTSASAIAPSGSEDFRLHATKSSPGNLSQSSNRKDMENENENFVMVTMENDAKAKTEAGFRNNSQMMNDASLPGASSGGRSRKNKGGNADNKEVLERQESKVWQEDIQVGCRELRARRYITDGFCTSEKPIKEVVCAGNCLPIMDMPWYAEFLKTLARTKLRDWQCVEDIVHKKRVKLLCQDATLRTYRIKVVKSCKCKKITKKHNRTATKSKRRRRRKRKGRKNKSRKGS